MHRFFVDPACISGARVEFPPEVSRQIASVLRLKAGELVGVLDNLGGLFTVRLTEVAARACQGEVSGRELAGGEPPVRLDLYLALTQREKFEWMLQKCTETGAGSFTPVVCARSLAQDPREADGKRERWQRIAQEAAEQCERGRIPEIKPALRFGQALQAAQAAGGLALLAWEREGSTPIAQLLRSAGKLDRLALFVGPEGGFAPEELQAARAAGLGLAGLGPRILRMETAAVAACVLAMDVLEQGWPG